ncbi:MAG TPA: hypothetical protein VM864_10390 [Pyrinomonadaceae bacterium]|jgi:hypothetical protein|nr:hypothetical protein [Pyrinomonadaceae bacterium]
MSRLEQFRETLATYRRHGWQLARALMTPETLDALRRAEPDAGGAPGAGLTFEGASVSESEFDAMWFRRAAAAGREAWELRLAAEPYALFELFEADEAEEDREDVRRELEAKVREGMRAEGTKDEG